MSFACPRAHDDVMGKRKPGDALRAALAAAVEVFKEADPESGERQRESLLDFVPRVSPRFKRPEHLARLVSLLERAHKEPLRVLVSVPPRHGKTEVANWPPVTVDFLCAVYGVLEIW